MVIFWYAFHSLDLVNVHFGNLELVNVAGDNPELGNVVVEYNPEWVIGKVDLCDIA